MLGQLLNGAEEVWEKFGEVGGEGLEERAIFAGVVWIEIGDGVIN
jgi:hypothetical protein